MRMVLQLFLFFLLLMGLPDWYIYRNYIKRCTNRWFRYAYWLPTIGLLVWMALIFLMFEPRPKAMNFMSIFLITFLCVNVPKAVFTLLSLLFRFIAKTLGRGFHESWLAGAIALYTMGYLIFGAVMGKEYFQVKEVTINSKDIPEAFNGYRIVQLSDIHIGSWEGNTKAIQKAVGKINALQPDLIVFTGDLVNNLASELDEFIPILSQLKAKDGIYSVLGNHDYSLYIQWENEEEQKANLDSLKAKEAQMGWQLLNNRHVKLHHQGDSIALIGVENGGNPPFPNYADLKGAIQGTEGMFKILLSHDPSHWRREVLPDTDIHLTLAGHTHAMQTKILGFSPSRFVYPEYEGLYKEDGQMLYVNVGLGYLMFPMRLGAWPEITLFTLNTEPTK